MKIFSPKATSNYGLTAILIRFSTKVGLLAVTVVILSCSAFAQVNTEDQGHSNVRINGEQYEELFRYFVNGVKQMQTRTGISDLDYVQFLRYYLNVLDSDKIVFGKAIRASQITLSNADQNQERITKEWVDRYQKYLVIKQEYPSSVAEYSETPHRPRQSCAPACNNIDFSQGTLNGWYAYYANNNSDFAPCNGACFDLNQITGGLQGGVTKMVPIDPNTNSYQVHITTGAGLDKLNPANPVPVVSPWATGHYSCMIGDSIGFDYGAAILSQKFMVSPSNSNFSYSYALFLENPPSHPYYIQPFFHVTLLDSSGDTIPFCGSYNVVSGDRQTGLKAFYYAPDGDSVFEKQWTIVDVPLKKYIGQCVTIQFEIADCGYGGHFGYAYVDASCSPLGVIASSPAFCGQKTLTLTAPPGASKYGWSGPVGGIVGQDTAQSIVIDSSGTYDVILTPVTGSACNDTIKITIPKLPGPPPLPFFSADTVCAGDSTLFTNLSTQPGSPWAGCKFYWDFYNIGNWNDTVNANPYWSYLSAGLYKVKLQEISSNGCGSDTILTIKVDSAINGSFTISPNPQCVKQPVTFTNNTTGGTSYKWNFGNPSSGPADTTSTKNATHTYDSVGTYIVTLTAKSAAGCTQVLKDSVKILALPKPTITGTDSICPAAVNGTLTASSGFTSYSWAPGGQNTQTVTGLSAGSYTVTVFNGTCYGDTSFTIFTKPNPNASITARPDSICAGDSSTLTANGGGTYAWSNPPGGSRQIVRVAAGTYTVAVTKNGCTHDTTITVVPLSNTPPSIGLTLNNLCPNDSTVLQAAGGTKYK